MEVLLVIALQATLVGTLVFGTKGLPRGEWDDNPLSLGQAKALQGFLALCIVFHHCAQQVFHDRWGSAVGPSGLEVMALIGFAFVGVGAYVLAGIVVTRAFSGVDRYMVFLGKWWYNTAILFPLGYLFGRREREAWAWMRGSYRKQVACSVAIFVGCFALSLVFGVGFSLPPVAFVFEILCAIGFTWVLLLFSFAGRRPAGC